MSYIGQAPSTSNPVATTSQLGSVKVDGVTIAVSGDGTLSDAVPTGTTYSYSGSVVSQISESVGGHTRTTDYTYNGDGTVNTAVTKIDTVTVKTETFGYSSGKLVSITVT